MLSPQDREPKTSEERFHLKLELPTCKIGADMEGEDPQNPSMLASRIERIVADHPKVRRDGHKATLLDRATGHCYEIAVDDRDPAAWTWTRLTFALAPIRAKDPLPVSVNDFAAMDWREDRTGMDRATHIQTAFERRKSVQEMATLESTEQPA